MRHIGIIAAPLAGAVLLAGCNTYDVSPVTPSTVQLGHPPVVLAARPLAPEVMLVVDRSGSMADAADGSNTGVCNAAGQNHLSCKWDALLSAFTGEDSAHGGFLAQLTTLSASSDPNDLVQLGLVTFGGQTAADPATFDAACKPGVVQVGLGAQNGEAIASALLAIPPGGATPTAATLEVAKEAFGAPDGHPRYVVLVTDGEPNCSAQVPLTDAACGGARCTESCDPTTGISTDSRGCLDEAGLLEKVSELAGANISTFVIGLGNATASGTAATVLDEAARAGGVPNPAIVNGEPAYYQANDDADLAAATQAILGRLKDQCQVPLDGTPASDQLVEVQVTLCNQPAQRLAPGDWTISGDTLTIGDGQICDAVDHAAAACPAQIQLSYVAR